MRILVCVSVIVFLVILVCRAIPLFTPIPECPSVAFTPQETPYLTWTGCRLDNNVTSGDVSINSIWISECSKK